ncbi:hypothetical protein [Rhodococcus sp. SJ-2]
MTEQQTDQTTDVPDDTTEDTPIADVTPEVETDDTELDEGKEAAKYRRRLRDTEKERDALIGQVDALRRAAIDKEVKGTHRVAPEGFWASGITVDQLLDDDGNIDTEKIRAAVKDAVTRLGLTQTRRGYVRGEGANPHPKETSNWVGAFK